MGWCHEFGVDIKDPCDHPMVADTQSCRCPTCGAVCEGRFEGCARVWARGPLDVTIVRAPHDDRRRQRAAALAPSVRHPTDLSVSNGTADTSPISSGTVGTARPEPEHASHDASRLPVDRREAPPEGDPELASMIEAMRSEVRELTNVLESVPRTAETEHLVTLALEVPRRAQAVLARAIVRGDAADLGQLEEVRSVVAAAREAFHWRASDHENGDSPGAGSAANAAASPSSERTAD